ncbi:Mu transposase C-terminal domain-containing protein [Cellvibrio mixtus]|uniref:Mu transposase C-terminal domain-containing protein n=1 Tax=Cellvibrio mixtus TaxID=39650 RepID=UPI0005867E31|nr:Mu transposase C-terminal domain-containing protein [Cellvibrio mixtus]
MSVDLWIDGVIVEFVKEGSCHRAIIRQVGKNEIIVADISDGTTERLNKTSLREMYDSGEVRFLAESRDHGELKFFDLTEKEQRETNRKYLYIKRLKEKGINKITAKSAEIIIREMATELDEDPPHWQSVRNWYKNFIDAGQKLRGLYPKHRFKGCCSPKIDAKVLAIIQSEAKRYYKLSQPTMASIVRNIEDKIIAHNIDNPQNPLEAPSYLTIQKRVMAGLYHNKQKARQGARAFKAELSGAVSAIETNRILERVEMDHTLLDIHVLHDDHKTLLGRPNITVLIDHYSHMVLGYQLSFEKPSFAAVCMACMNAFLPKESFLNAIGCDSVWPAHGIPTTLVTDNGNEFWGKNFIAVADEVGSIFQYCPVRKGNYKSRIERFFGIVNSLVIDDLPGVVRKQGKSGDGYDARQEAKMTFSEFKRYFTTWLTEIYHGLPIEESGMTPNELWKKSEEQFPVPLEDEMDLTPILMATHSRELSKTGIRIFGMDYNSSILKDMYRRDGPGTVTVKCNPFDIGYILVLDQVNKIYLKVNCENYSYASGISEFEHNKIKAEAKNLGKSKLDNLDLQRARVKLSQERDKLHARNARRKTQVTVTKAARSEKIGVNDLKLVINNSKNMLYLDSEVEEDELNLDGWSRS